jgi:hypothetical protein
VTSNTLRCSLCGRLVARLQGRFCSERCERVDCSAYASPLIPETLLRPPSTTLDARIILENAPVETLPAGVEEGCGIGSPDSGRRLVRVGAGTREELERALEDLRSLAGAGHVQLFTVQQFSASAIDRNRDLRNDHGGGE